MSKLVNLTMFRGYVNKVLPTVYDDSLSYYEVLAKVMEKINEIINLDNAQNEIINNIPEDVSEFAEDLAQFKSSMTQQFNDFKTEINADFDAFEAEVNAKVAADSTPTQGSTKLVTSGGVYASLQDIINSLVKDARPTEDSTNYVTSGGVWKAINDAVEDLEATLDTKQNALTWDTTPTANSINPVQSGGIKSYVDNAAQTVQNNLDTYITNNNNRVSGIEGDITDLETGKQDALTFDLAPTLGSNNPVTSNGIAQAIAGVTPSIEVDPVPTQGSTNPVSSNGVYVAVSGLETELEEGLADKQNTLAWDTTPTKNSQNPVTSGGLFEKFAQIDPYGTVDPEPEQGSPNAVSSGGTWTALQTLNNDLTAAIDTKQDILTFDSVPTEDSENPVYSGGVFTELNGKQDTLTFDSIPTEDSENPVYSGGVFAELELKEDKTEAAQHEIGGSVSGNAISVSDSADANVQGLTIYGKSRVSENLIDYSKAKNLAPNIYLGNLTISASSARLCTPPIKVTTGDYISITYPTGFKLASIFIITTGTISAGDSFSEYSYKQAESGIGYYTYQAEATGYLYFYMVPVPSHDVSPSDISTFMAVKGQVPKSYEPYGIISIGDSGELDVQTCGKNLFDMDNPDYPNSVLSQQGEITYSSDYNTYKFSGKKSYMFSMTKGTEFDVVRWGKETNGSIERMTDSTIPIRMNVTEYDALYISIGKSAVFGSNYQLELDSTPTAYKPYISSTATLTTGLPLCGIPVTQGETYTDGDGVKWLADTADVEGVVKRCEKVVFDGSEDEEWSTLSGSVITPDGSNSFYISIAKSTSAHGNDNPGVFIATIDSDTPSHIYNGTAFVKNVMFVGDASSSSQIGIRIYGVGTTSDLKTYLASNPVTAVYELATPTTQELTSAEKSALLNLKTFDSTTNLSITDDPFVDFEYLLNTKNGESIAQLEDNINVALDNKQDVLTFDNEPTDSSTNPVTSGGVYMALSGKQDTLTWDNAPTEDSNNAISSGAVYNAIQSSGGMQRTLLYTNTTPLVLPATVTFGSDIRAYDVLQIEYTRLDTAVNDTITPQYIEIPVDTLDAYYTDYTGIYNVGVMLPGIDTEEVFYEINGLFTELTYNQSRSVLPTDITLNISRIFGVSYS